MTLKRWDKFFIYDEPEYRDMLLRISRNESAYIRVLILFLEHKEDPRVEWIKKEVSSRDISVYQTCVYVLVILGIRECCAGCTYYYDGTQWPKETYENRRVHTAEERVKNNQSAICSQCLNTGWYHEVCFPPGTPGFTQGYAPAIYDIAFPGETVNETRERVREWSMRETAITFRRIYSQFDNGNKKRKRFWLW